MALARRSGQRFQASIWPGFVDAMTGLLMVLMFVLTIFTVVQFALRDVISGQETELDELSSEVNLLAEALGLEKTRNTDLTLRVSQLDDALLTARDDITAKQAALERAREDISDFESQVAMQDAQLTQASRDLNALELQLSQLLEERAARAAELADVSQELTLVTEKEAQNRAQNNALETALLATRNELDAQMQAARLAAAQAEAYEALIADLREKDAARALEIDAKSQALDAAEAARLTEVAAAEALRTRLQNSEAALSTLNLALEAERQRAEETLTLLAAARAQAEAANDARQIQTTALEELARKDALLVEARRALSAQEVLSIEARQEVEALNLQVEELRQQISGLRDLLDVSEAEVQASQRQMDDLGLELNAALARAATEERLRAELEEAERQRIEAERDRLAREAENLAQYKSDFFGEVKKIVAGLDGVEVEGDRFVFSSEVLFGRGDAVLSRDGKTQISNVAQTLKDIAAQIPPEIDWIIRVDGHTDDEPLLGVGKYQDNWELSQARALSVVRFMAGELNIPPRRLSANGFGEFRPLVFGTGPEARAANRRIELKLTER